ncbi:VOC family protein [Streptomyces tubbatahanensis]|uniref:VOC family protein n=1 Tax=Streptomyces tubbatahanensis TaxID=2923272 RepID=A0ABY3XWH0_9ACTN|nr:VOC family protein [Streptomyces tubbatahanensis]UNS98747.1 VOC family protein [Streptomyces tubbatahanensis]
MSTPSPAHHGWPDQLAVGAVRFARPTARFDAVRAFYVDDLGLPVLAEWRDHSGYDGLVLGLPGTPDPSVHMELTQHGAPPRIPAPHPENQLVLYLENQAAHDRATAHLTSRGHRPVTAANPYWPTRGATVSTDPDGWQLVLAPWVFGRDPVPDARR